MTVVPQSVPGDVPSGPMHVLDLGVCDDLAAFIPVLAQRAGLCWLDGAPQHPDGRWSFLAVDPVERIRVPWSADDPLAAFDRLEPGSGSPRTVLAEQATSTGDSDASPRASPAPAEVPRWVGYVAYDACHAPLRARAHLAREAATAVLSFHRYDALLALDHRTRRLFIVGDDAASSTRLHDKLRARPTPLPNAGRLGALRATPAEQHRAAIERALEHITAGDIYQVNLARCWSAAYQGSAWPLWYGLREASPVPFGFYFDEGGEKPAGPSNVVMARTMERFLRFSRSSCELVTRPIKGTLARLGNRDSFEARALLTDPKERAEHAMIVDLMRNDLGRVAQYGSVQVVAPFAIEPFAGLSHMVSTVRCRARPEVGLRAVLEATFPPGSVTGAPKLRAIEIIEQLETVPRGAYTGAVGFVDREGGLSLAVAIRTAVLNRGHLQYFAGGGIVEASDPVREIAETELKARVFLDALHSSGVLG